MIVVITLRVMKRREAYYPSNDPLAEFVHSVSHLHVTHHDGA